MKRVEELYPDPKARRKADEAIDQHPDDRPMHEFTALWLDTYTKHAGPRAK